MSTEIAKRTAIATADGNLREAGLATYSELQAALAELHANSWLDASPGENEYVAKAKELARKAFEASQLN